MAIGAMAKIAGGSPPHEPGSPKMKTGAPSGLEETEKYLPMNQGSQPSLPSVSLPSPPQELPNWARRRTPSVDLVNRLQSRVSGSPST